MADPRLHDRLFLLDGSSLAFRAFFALPESIATQAGQPTNALFGLSQMLLKIVSEYRPANIVVAWDAREKTFRDELYEEYKAQRPHMPEGLSAQWPLLPELMDGFGIVNLVRPGYEADDILGTLAEEAKRQGTGSVVVTGDRDAMQLVDDDIWVMSTGRGVTDVKIYTPAAVVERFGVTPAQIPDYIGLKGDSSDNIPGVPGIGEKTAAQLLQQFGSIDALYSRLDEVKSEKRRAVLREHEGAARLSLQLATMVLDVPLEHDLVDLVTRGGYALPVEQVEAAFERFEFRNLKRRLHEIADAASTAAVPAPAPAAAGGPLVRLVSEPDVGPLGGAAREGRGGGRLRAQGRHRGPGRRRPRRRRRVLRGAGRRRARRRAVAAGRARRGARRQVPARLRPRAGRAGLRHGGRRLPPGARAPGEGTRPLRPRRRRRRRPARGGAGGRSRRGHARHAHVARGRGPAAAPRRARPRAALP